jgi:hypothetical protein
MVSNRTHAETLVQCLDLYLAARDLAGVGVVDYAERTREQLVFAIEMTLNDLVSTTEEPHGTPTQEA